MQISENTTASLLQHVENTLSLVENYMENVAATVEQNNDIQTYLRNPDTKNKTRASVRLNNLTSYMGMIRGIAIIGQNAPAIDSMTNIVGRSECAGFGEFSNMTEHWFQSFLFSCVPGYRRFNSYCTVAYARNYYLNNQWCTIIMFVNLNNTLKDIRGLAGSSLDAWYLVDSTGNTFYEYGSEEDIVDAREALVQNDDKKNDSKNKRKALTGDIVFHDKSATCGYEVVSIVNKESIWMVLFPYIAGLFGTLAIFLLLVLFMNYRNINTLINPVLVLSQHMLMAAKEIWTAKWSLTGKMRLVSWNPLLIK